MTKQCWADACTQNCVWVFQTRQKVITNRVDLDFLSKSDLIQECLNYTKSIREIIRYVKEYEDEGRYPECLIEIEDDTWYTEAVFLFREEARNYGKSRPYAWGEENSGWRIYGVPLKGQAVELLSDAGVNQELIDLRLKDLNAKTEQQLEYEKMLELVEKKVDKQFENRREFYKDNFKSLE